MEIISASEGLSKRDIVKLTDSYGYEKPADHEGEVFDIVQYVIYMDTNKDGEEVKRLRFVTDSGTVIGTSSGVMISKFEKLLNELGMPLTEVEIESSVSKNFGNKYYFLTLK